MRELRKVAAAWPAAILLGSLVLAAGYGQQTTVSLPVEPDSKAGYIFNILQFVEQRAIVMPSGVLTLGIYEAGPVEAALRLLEGSTIRGRKLHLRVVQLEADVAGCDAVFFGRSAGKAAKILAAAASKDLLTIGNDAEFLPSGGMIALLGDARRVVIEISPGTAASSKWKISSHLLEVARIANRSTP